MSLFLLMWLLANGRLAALVSSRGRGFARDPSRPTGRPAARPRQRLRQVRYVATVPTVATGTTAVPGTVICGAPHRAKAHIWATDIFRRPADHARRVRSVDAWRRVPVHLVGGAQHAGRQARASERTSASRLRRSVVTSSSNRIQSCCSALAGSTTRVGDARTAAGARGRHDRRI